MKFGGFLMKCVQAAMGKKKNALQPVGEKRMDEKQEKRHVQVVVNSRIYFGMSCPEVSYYSKFGGPRA